MRGYIALVERKRQNNIEMKRMIVDTQAERQTCKRTDRCSDGEREKERERWTDKKTVR
jgi:hypothetical protein